MKYTPNSQYQFMQAFFFDFFFLTYINNDSLNFKIWLSKCLEHAKNWSPLNHSSATQSCFLEKKNTHRFKYSKHF